jgi:hypothetical protein
MRFAFIALIGVVFLVSCSHKKKSKKITQTEVIQESSCKSSREFITTLEYLRTKKEYELSEVQAQDVAQKVSSGCTDASKRFIQTTELLLKAEMNANKAFEYGIKFSQQSNESHQTFQKIFKESFVQDLLDLDLMTALETAYNLSMNFNGNYQDLSNDFNYLVRFCVEQKNLGLPLKECAQYATRLARIGGDIEMPIAMTFKRGFDYLGKPEKANLPTADILKVIEKILPYGQVGLENFQQAFDYAIDPKGLGLGIKDAIQFSLALAAKTKPN